MKRLPVVALIPLLLLAQLLLPSAFAQWSGAHISVVPTSVQCGNSVTVSGSGWPANSTVNIDIVQLSPAYVTPVQVQTDRTGSFGNAQLFIPSTVTSGTYTVSAQTGSTTPVTAPLTVTCSATSTPTLQVQPQQVFPGGTITVSGSGFPAGTTISLLVGPQGNAALLSQTVLSDGNGNLSASFTIPVNAPNGTYDVSAQAGAASLASASFEVVANAQITSIVPNPAPPGSTVTLSAIDLPVGTTVTAVITCNGGNTQATGTVDSNGQLSLSFEVPSSAASGQCQVQLEEGGSTLATGTFQVQQTATFTLNPSAVPAGGSVTVSGTGFLPNSSVTAQVTIALSGGGTQTVTQGSVTDGSGTFSLTLSVPGNALPGSYLVGIYQNGATNASATATLTVTQATAIQLVPSTQVPGDSSSITVIGTGFDANEAVTVGYLATLTAGGQQQISVTGQADPSGNISIALPVPATVAGDTTYTVTAVGQTSGFTASAQLTVSLNPQLSANPSTVNSGGTVSISGEQFPQNTTATITAQIPLANGGSQTVSPTAQAGSDGTFAVQVPIPANAASGSVTFTASAVGPTNQTYTASTTVTITSIPATISVSSGTASPGDQLTVTGDGFAPGPNALITVALTYATNSGQQTVTQMIDASSSGTFTTVLAVPGDAISGTATITATQVASGETASTTLAIQTPLPTSTPTSTPTATSVPPTPTASPVPPTSTATPVPKSPVHLKIKYVSLWYHAVRLGTFNHVEIRTNKKMQLPVTMRVVFPRGRELAYTGFTTAQGVWNKTFPVARNVTNRSGSLAQIRITVKRNFTATVILSFVLIG